MKKITQFLLILILIFSTATPIYSRAGGGGGKSSSSSSSSSSSHSSSSGHHSSGSSTQAPSWVVKIVAGIVIAIVCGFIFIIIKAVTYSKKQTKKGKVSTTEPNIEIINEQFISANPGFNKEAFKAKVKTAFMAIQKAWEQQDLSKVRNWISDGVYQRFSLQFDMMKQLGQKNMLSNISITEIRFIKTSIESTYSIITVAIYFKMDDRFISEKLPELNENYTGEEAMEYWTFVKKSGAIEKDLYQNNSCPNCGNQLNKEGGEVSKCPSCSTITYLGDYDWVLSEITQEDDYEDDKDVDPNNKDLIPLRNEEEFCMQNMEDKASNAFVQYLFASVWNKTLHFKRFATNEVIAGMEKENDEPYIYNRVYINRVTYSDYVCEEDTHHLSFTVAYSAQKVILAGNKIKKLDDDIETFWGDLTLSRKTGKADTKSKIWSHECANCGAPYNDSTNSSCDYCHEKINSTIHDWIVTSVSID